jgi:hypothetical protein
VNSQNTKGEKEEEERGCPSFSRFSSFGVYLGFGAWDLGFIS